MINDRSYIVFHDLATTSKHKVKRHLFPTLSPKNNKLSIMTYIRQKDLGNVNQVL
jgi:hypothetical protein